MSIVTRVVRISFLAVTAAAATLLLIPVFGSLSWASAPLFASVIGFPFLCGVALCRMPRGVSQGWLWIACAATYPVLSFVAGLAWVGIVARGDPVPQGALATAGMAFIVAFLIALGLLGHGLKMVIESRMRIGGDSSDDVASR